MATKPQVVQTIRKLRHWKQHFDKNARFVWRRETTWPNADNSGTVTFPAGSLVPDWVVATMGAKLRRFWESQRIELYEVKPDSETAAPEPAEPAQADESEAGTATSKKKSVRRKATSRPATDASQTE